MVDGSVRDPDVTQAHALLAEQRRRCEAEKRVIDAARRLVDALEPTAWTEGPTPTEWVLHGISSARNELREALRRLDPQP